MGITANGYETTPTAEIEKDLQALFRGALGKDLSLDPESPQGQLISLFTDILHQVDQHRQDDFYARDVYHANGLQLDVIGREFDLPRKLSVPTQILVTLKGAVNFTVPAGTLCNVVNDPEKTFQFGEDVKITSDEQQVTLSAADGSVYSNLTVGTKLATQEYTPQIYDMTISSIVYGQPAETDYQYRIRLINSMGANVDEVQRLTLDLQNINNVLAAYVEPNNTLETSASGIPSHAVEIVVLGGGEADIAEVLLNHLFATPTYQDPTLGEAVTGLDYNGHNQTFYVTRPAAVGVTVSVKYANKVGRSLTPANILDLKAKISSLINATYMNKTLYKSDICNLITVNYGDTAAIDTLTVTVGGANMDASYTCTSRQYLTVSSGDITFTEAD